MFLSFVLLSTYIIGIASLILELTFPINEAVLVFPLHLRLINDCFEFLLTKNLELITFI